MPPKSLNRHVRTLRTQWICYCLWKHNKNIDWSTDTFYDVINRINLLWIHASTPTLGLSYWADRRWQILGETLLGENIANIFAENRSITSRGRLLYKVRMEQSMPVRVCQYVPECFFCAQSDRRCHCAVKYFRNWLWKPQPWVAWRNWNFGTGRWM